ncbi:hypothetical protein BOX15_Mlig007960g1 [Macrostomum lignano]|uniref:Dimethylglycine dehydrogenase, mitochondrial n=1 Tax=Macrostomum lignano TaxID=282301 RepID=A0A267GLA3_9PLAT|nr:hypothetical protein BOX15_Mlig007960g1 [Macrostomum lignano]
MLNCSKINKSLACATKAGRLTSSWPASVRAVSSSTEQQRQHPLSKRSSNEAEVVIIGGGIVGVSTAYHLAKAGVKDVVLLEKSELTAGSTWHAAGLTTFFHPGINVRRVHYYSMQLYSQLEAETDQPVGLHTPGSLRLITTPTRMDEARYQMSRAAWCQAEQHLVGPEKCLELCPLLNMSTVLGGIYNPGDGHIDPYSVTMALAAGARKYGAELYQNSQVRATSQDSKGIWTIVTDHGELKSKHLVNAAGFHARDVGKLSGLDLPIIPVHHQYVITKAVPEVVELKRELPVLRDLEASYYLRQEKQGLLVGPYESAENMMLCTDWYDNGVPDSFGRELFEPDLGRIMPHLERAMEMVPAMQNAEIQSVISGPITYNAENAGLIGPVEGPLNYWLLGGLGYGIIHGGGVGKYVADWIRTGEPPYDLIELDANRYGWWADRSYTHAKSRETYGLNNAVGYPKEERFAGRPTKRAAQTSALYDELKSAGAEFGFHNGWEQPHWFGLTEEERRYEPSFRRGNWFPAMQRECEGVLNRAGVMDITPFSKFEISGPRAGEFLDLVTANRLPKVNRTCITHMLTPRGRVFSEMTLTCLPADDGQQKFRALTGSGSEMHDLIWLKDWRHKLRFQDGVKIDNVTDSIGCLSVAGPLSREILQSLTSESLDAGSYPFLQAKQLQIDGVDCLAIRISYTGELGWELYCGIGELPRLYKSIWRSGQPLGLVNFGSYAMNSLRLEKGFAMWGAEMNCDTGPLEAGLGGFIRLGKSADFVGKAAVAEAKLKLQQDGARQLRMLRVDSVDVDPEGNESVWLDGKVVGNTTSGSYSFSRGHGLAFAYVPASLGASTQLEVDLLGRRVPAVVLSKPPLLPEQARKKTPEVASVGSGQQ